MYLQFCKVTLHMEGAGFIALEQPMVMSNIGSNKLAEAKDYASQKQKDDIAFTFPRLPLKNKTIGSMKVTFTHSID